MRSFEYGYLLETPLLHAQAMTVRALGEFRGREALYSQQSPEVLETMRKVAIVQSTESSNRIEGITVGRERIQPLVMKQVKPRDRSEQEVAGYSDVLNDIHTNYDRMNHDYPGVDVLIREAGIKTVPEARVAAFVGNAWDPQEGRETPSRRHGHPGHCEKQRIAELAAMNHAKSIDNQFALHILLPCKK